MNIDLSCIMDPDTEISLGLGGTTLKRQTPPQSLPNVEAGRGFQDRGHFLHPDVI